MASKCDICDTEWTGEATHRRGQDCVAPLRAKLDTLRNEIDSLNKGLRSATTQIEAERQAVRDVIAKFDARLEALLRRVTKIEHPGMKEKKP